MDIDGIVIDLKDFNDIKNTINIIQTVLKFNRSKYQTKDYETVCKTIENNISKINQIIK